MAEPNLSGAIGALYEDALAGLSRALSGGTALLVSRVGDGERLFLEQYHRPLLTIDATLFPGRTSFREQLLRTAVNRLLGREPSAVLGDLGPDADAARQTLVEAYGSSSSHVMIQIENGTTGRLRLSLSETLAGVEAHVPLVVFDAHRLDLDARWDVRELERPVLLVTRPEHVRGLTAQDAPFYGQTQTIMLRAPGVREWMRALDGVGHRIQPTDLEWLLDRTRGRVGTTMSAVRLKTSQISYRTAWRAAVQNTFAQAHELLALARAVHSDAPTLLLALADGRQPYKAIPDAPSQRIARAMAKLRELDVVERPERNVSQIADPLVEHALKSMLSSNRMRQALEDVYLET